MCASVCLVMCVSVCAPKPKEFCRAARHDPNRNGSHFQPDLGMVRMRVAALSVSKHPARSSYECCICTYCCCSRTTVRVHCSPSRSHTRSLYIGTPIKRKSACGMQSSDSFSLASDRRRSRLHCTSIRATSCSPSLLSQLPNVEVKGS